MSKPQQPSLPRPGAEAASDPRIAENGLAGPTWLAAAALIASLDEPVPDPGGLLDFIGLDRPDAVLDTAPSGASATKASTGWVSAEPPWLAGWADGAVLESDVPPAWHMLDDNPVLPFDDLPHDFAHAHQTVVWSDGPSPAAFAGQGPGQNQSGPGNDLIFLDGLSDARSEKADKGGGGNGGSKGNKGGSGDGSEPGALSEYLSGDPGGYNILVDFKGAWTSAL